MLTRMTTTGTPAEIAKDLDSLDPAVGLRAVAALGRLLEQIETLQVRNARARGWSWQEIAAALGVTKQTVHRKHGKRL
jgi:DNA-binding NarL/FixJ family response regulator